MSSSSSSSKWANGTLKRCKVFKWEGERDADDFHIRSLHTRSLPLLFVPHAHFFPFNFQKHVQIYYIFEWWSIFEWYESTRCRIQIKTDALKRFFLLLRLLQTMHTWFVFFSFLLSSFLLFYCSLYIHHIKALM